MKLFNRKRKLSIQIRDYYLDISGFLWKKGLFCELKK